MPVCTSALNANCRVMYGLDGVPASLESVVLHCAVLLVNLGSIERRIRVKVVFITIKRDKATDQLQFAQEHSIPTTSAA